MKQKYFNLIKVGAELMASALKNMIKYPLKFIFVFILGGILMFLGIFIWQFFKPIKSYFKRKNEEEIAKLEPFYNRINRKK